jgi:hypothetical protein
MRIAPVSFRATQACAKKAPIQDIKYDNLKTLKSDMFSKEAQRKSKSVEITDKATGKKVDAKLVEETTGDSVNYEILINGLIIGSASAYAIYPRNTNMRTLPEEYLKNGALYVLCIENDKRDNYEGVGKILHQSMFEKSKEMGLGGRVALKAAYGSHCFHAKCGFVATPAYSNEQKTIEKALLDEKRKKIKPKTWNLSMVEMYLPKENAEALYGNF